MYCDGMAMGVCDGWCREKKPRSPSLIKIATVAMDEYEETLVKIVRISLRPLNPIDVYINLFHF